MKRAVTLLLMVLVAEVLFANSQGAVLPSLASGVFTKEQAQRGKTLYETNCASCHGFELVADDPAAGDLTGLQFRLRWQGKTVGERFEKIRTTMPPGAQDALSDQEYLDIVTYILSFNGYPAGKEELAPDREGLGQLVIVPRPESGAQP